MRRAFAAGHGFSAGGMREVQAGSALFSYSRIAQCRFSYSRIAQRGFSTTSLLNAGSVGACLQQWPRAFTAEVWSE